MTLTLSVIKADPTNTPGLILSPNLAKSFRFVIMDVDCTEGDRVIELVAAARFAHALDPCVGFSVAIEHA